jgi:exosortase
MLIVGAGVAMLAVPTIISLGQLHWSTDNGAHGPLILVSALWLFWRERANIEWRPGSIHGAWLLLLLPLLFTYFVGRSLGMIGTEAAALYLIFVLLGFTYWGPAIMRRLWFAILYAAFLVKPPEGPIAELTSPLKVWLSSMAVDLLHLAGYPIGKSGVLIQVAQYELLVAQACAGLGSLVTLLAMGLLYVHLTQPEARAHKVILIASIIPIAILANLVRIIFLVLLTYHVSDGVAQGFAHDLAGVVTFALSMLGMLALDALLQRRRGS